MKTEVEYEMAREWLWVKKDEAALDQIKKLVEKHSELWVFRQVKRVPPVGVQSFLAGLMEGRVGSRRGLKRRRRVRRAFGGSSRAGTVRDGL